MLSGTARGKRPARFRDVFASTEFRAVYAASTLSWLGDYVARAAVTALVFNQTGSVAASAAAFAISYAPWLLGGYLLVAVAERHSYRKVMVSCDVARMVIMALVALPGLPLPAMLVLLLCSALFTPPFDAARSAMLPAILGPDRYVVGVAVHVSSAAPVQVAGYFLGASLAAVSPRLALLINAATFGVSAALIRLGVRAREPGLSRERRTGLLRETADGFRLVFTNPALRAIVLLVFCGVLFPAVPEGLGAAWAARFPTDVDRGWAQGLIMGSVPLGLILGSLCVSRLVPAERRSRLLRPLAVLTPLALVPTLADPPVILAAGFALVSGFAVGALVPVANGEFVRALPNAYRARAFGVVQGGLQLLQGLAVLVTGALAMGRDLPLVVGLWGLGGVGLMLMLSMLWPSPQAFAEAGARAAELNRATTGAEDGLADDGLAAPQPVRAEHSAQPQSAPDGQSGHHDGSVPDGHGAAEPPAASGPLPTPGGPSRPGYRRLLAVMGTARRRVPAPQAGTMDE